MIVYYIWEQNSRSNADDGQDKEPLIERAFQSARSVSQQVKR